MSGGGGTAVLLLVGLVASLVITLVLVAGRARAVRTNDENRARSLSRALIVAAAVTAVLTVGLLVALNAR